MQIPIRFPNNGQVPNESSSSLTPLPPQLATLGTGEVVLIEMQGSLEVEGDKSNGFIGVLNVDDDKTTMRIGHHLLEGKIASLAKPIAVLRKTETKASNSAAHEAGLDVPVSEPSFDIVSIAKRKIVFSKRPVPIVRHVDLGSSRSKGR